MRFPVLVSSLAALLLAGTVWGSSEMIDERQGDLKAPALAGAVEGEKGALWTPPALRDPDEAWVEAALAAMTLDQKIGQMIMPQWSPASAPSLMANYHVGGFIFLRVDAATALNATNTLQQQADFPLWFAVDCEAGAGARITEGTIFPMNMAQAAARDTLLAREQGVVTARECRALGIQIGFGPVLDVNTEPKNPVISIRSSSDDPGLVARMAAAYVEGAASAGMLTTFKHYPGHGHTDLDSHLALPVVTLDCDTVFNTHVKPYETLIGQGLGDLVMSAHVWYPCLDPGTQPWPATLSEAALTGWLREDLGFEGVVISDAFNMAGLQNAISTSDGARIAVQAGMDVILMAPSTADAFNGIKNGVLGGQLSEERINQSVRRILRLKSKVGLPEATTVPVENLDILGAAEHWAGAEAIGEKALSKARVQPGVLPLSTDMDVLVLAFSTNDSIFYRYGSFEFTDPFLTTLPTADVRTVFTNLSDSERAALVARAAIADRVVVTSRTWRPNNSSGQDALLRDLVAIDTPLIYLSFGSPYHDLNVPGLENFFCGFSSHYSTQRHAVDVLFGEAEAQAPWPVEVDLGLPPWAGWATY
ncbi:MAG: glycoside hydrolase family 3 N-terminal domain-containing protein [Sumerlaeia bacterium]